MLLFTVLEVTCHTFAKNTDQVLFLNPNKHTLLQKNKNQSVKISIMLLLNYYLAIVIS